MVNLFRTSLSTWAPLPLVVLSLFLGPTALAQSGEGGPAYPPLAKGAKSPVIKTAAEHEQQFVRRGVRFNDPELLIILNEVLETVLPVVTDSYIDFRVFLIRDPSPAAFSLADGQIYVHTGLLARLENEAQLAAVLAHEAHHIAAHHQIEADKYRRDRGNIGGAVSGMLNMNSGDDDGVFESNYRYVAQSEYSEDMEFEADAGSVALISQAGYAPDAVVRALEIFRQDPELTLDREFSSFNSPESLFERQGRVQALVRGMEHTPNPNIDGTRGVQLRRVIEMTIDDYIRLDRPGTALKFIESLINVEPDAFLYAAKGDSHHALGPRPVELEQEFFKWVVDGKVAEKTREEIYAKYLALEGGPERLAYNLESAASAYNTAVEFDENSARAYRGLGNLDYEQENYRQAGRNYVKYLKLESDSMDRPFVLERLQHIKVELTKQKEAGQ